MLEIYSTCPFGYGDDPAVFSRPFADVARWTESAGLRGLLIFTDNDSLDPWTAAQFIIERTATLVPIVAVQPAYMHPYTVARKVSSVGSLYGRRIDLNLVTGGYRPHLTALGAFVEHDRRYDRLLEYGRIVADLLRGQRPVSHNGAFYEVVKAVLNPALPAGITPRTFVAGSSPAAWEVANTLGAVRLTYPRHHSDYGNHLSPLDGAGIRIGIIARDTREAAWRVARRRYPPNALGETVHRAEAERFDAEWHGHLWRSSEQRHQRADPYWLHPFRVTREFCPFLVGSYREVGEILARYLAMGVTTLILNGPWEEDDLHHANRAIHQAQAVQPTRHTATDSTRANAPTSVSGPSSNQ